jgi:hypothetical protein
VADWVQNGDIHKANANGYRLAVFPYERFGTWGYIISDGARVVQSGDARELKAAKEQAERAALEHDKV